MGRKTNTTSAELERGWFRPRRAQAARVLLASVVTVAAGLGVSRDTGPEPAEAAILEASTTPTATIEQSTTNTSLETYSYLIPEAPPERAEVISQLGSYGLELVADPEDINFPDQFFVTANDGECAVQHGVAELPDGQINVSTYLFGPDWALTNEEITNLDGTERAYTAHAEGLLSIGTVFPGGEGSELHGVMTYLAETTHFLCDDFVPPAVVAMQNPDN